MQNKILTTPVDNLMDIIKEKKKVSLSQIKRELKLPQELIEKWLIILEEFKIVKLQYSGFEGYVTFVEKKDKSKSKNQLDIENLKDTFIEKSKEKDISYEKMRTLWPKFISEYETDIKLLFEERAKTQGYEELRIEKAWLKYKKELEAF